MKHLAVAVLAVALSGCAALQSQPQQTAALENVVLGLMCAQTGVCLVAGGAGAVGGGGCTAPAIPPELLAPCNTTTGTPEQVQAALTNCAINSAALIAVAKYSQRICGPTTASVATTPPATTTTTTTTPATATTPATTTVVTTPAPSSAPVAGPVMAPRTLLILPK